MVFMMSSIELLSSHDHIFVFYANEEHITKKKNLTQKRKTNNNLMLSLGTISESVNKGDLKTVRVNS